MTNTPAYALFATPIGHCGIAWGERGVTGVQLPEQNEAATRERMARRFPRCSESIAPFPVQNAIRAVVALLSGAPTDARADSRPMAAFRPSCVCC